MRDALVLMVLQQHLGGARGHLVERLGELALALGAEPTARLRCADHETGERRQLGGEGWSTPRRSRAGKRAQVAVHLARASVLSGTLTRPTVASPRRLTWRIAASVSAVSPDCDTNSAAPGRQRRVAVAELGADVQVDRQAGQLLEPVLGDHAGVVRGAAATMASAGWRSRPAALAG